MDSDISTSLTIAHSTMTRHSAQIAIVKKNHEMEMAFIQMIDQVARAALPPGQGKNVDKLA